jgi:hypothetical protein
MRKPSCYQGWVPPEVLTGVPLDCVGVEAGDCRPPELLEELLELEPLLELPLVEPELDELEPVPADAEEPSDDPDLAAEDPERGVAEPVGWFAEPVPVLEPVLAAA